MNMAFTSTLFLLVFAPLVIAGYWLIPPRLRLAWLTAASYAFYAWWDWRCCLVLLATTAINYIAGFRLHSARSRAESKAWFAVAVIGSVGLLVYFKYAVFAIQSSAALAAWLNISLHTSVPEIIAPIGLSFYTFQALTYSIDIFWKRTKPAQSFLHFAAFVSMFPQLISGPIVRWRHIQQQLLTQPRWLPLERANIGLTLVAAGLVKKVLIADRLAYYVDPLWSDYLRLAPAEAWLAMLGYGLQLYFDFSGYSLIAIGLAQLLGCSLPQNFNSPYRAASIGDFWRRWHMTLSAWLREYLFVALGGLHLRQRWFALLGTMLLTGLWHGAAWTFVVWGGYHGFLLLLHHLFRELKLKWRGGSWGTAGTLLLVMLGWMLFRAPDLHTAGYMYLKLIDVTDYGQASHLQLPFVLLIVLGFVWAVFAPNAYSLIFTQGVRPRPAVLVLLGFLAAAAVLFLSDSTPFLYYQF